MTGEVTEHRDEGREVSHFRIKEFCVADAKREKPGVELVRLDRGPCLLEGPECQVI